MSAFAGFDSPNTVPVPQQFFDDLMPDLSLGETRVLLYIIRRTFGFQKNRDAISLNQLCRGIARREGEALDRGTGLNKETVGIAVRSLVAKNMITVERQDSPERGHEANLYGLNLRTEIPTSLGRKNHARVGGISDSPSADDPSKPLADDSRKPIPVAPGSPIPDSPGIQKTVIQKTVDKKQLTNNQPPVVPLSRGTGKRREKKRPRDQTIGADLTDEGREALAGRMAARAEALGYEL